MSFAFTVRAQSKQLAVERCDEEFDRVVANQPVHELDRGAFGAAVAAYVALLPDDPGTDVLVSVSGSLNWRYVAGVAQACGAEVRVSTSLTPRSA